MSAHTSGPWEPTMHSPSGRAYGVHARVYGGGRVNVVNWGGLSRAASDEGLANARLMAAAPELLAALQSILIAKNDQEEYAAILQANDAIAKATGSAA